jgi:succinylglutamic semialdehyde dehydrogenase
MNLSYSYRGDYIQGKFVKVTDSNGEIANQNPGSLETPAVVFPYRFDHVNEAVTAAKRGFNTWRRIPLSDRLAALSRYREALSKEQDQLVQLLTLETGKPLWESRQEVAETLSFFDLTLKEAAERPLEASLTDAGPGMTGAVRLFPHGVAAVFGATDIPSLGAHRSFLPALVYGNTVVLKPSKYAPTVGQFFAHVSHEAGIPAGVFNVVHGGFEVGRRLAAHSGVDLVFFTGSYEKAQKIQKQIHGDFAKIFISDTGGKNSLLVWEDAQYDTALSHAFLSAFLTSGQRSLNSHRLLVHEKLFDKFVADFHQLAKKCRIGYGMNEGEDTPFLGPLLSEKSVENYLSIQGIAVREGAEEVMRGKPLERKERGYYVSPSIHIVEEPKPKSVYEQSEIFGPNVALYKVKDLDEAIEWINQAEYGLAASLYTQSKPILSRCLEEVRVGQLHWNLPTTHPCERLPMGGLRRSSNGRPMGSLAYTQCTYPVGLAEPKGGTSPVTLPPTLPRLK